MYQNIGARADTTAFHPSQSAFCYLYALFMKSNYDGICPKTRTCSCRNAQSRWSRAVHFVVDFHVKSAYNSKTNLFTKNTPMLRANLKKKKRRRGYITFFYFFFCDATVFFNEILGAILLNRRK